MTLPAPGITAVLPTFNRASALAATLDHYLRMAGIDELVIVDDGSTDCTAAVLAGCTDPRLRVIRHERNRGLPAARNTGAAEARHEWVLYIEDDCTMPVDYALELRRVAQAYDADVVSAPWLNVDPSRYDEAFHQGRARPTERINFHTYVGSFPSAPVETPFMCALALVRREVVCTVGYDETFRGSAFREETDFYLRAADAGFRCVLTPTTASCQVGRWDGGTRSTPWGYEWGVISSNWRFLRRHQRALRAHGVRHISLEQFRFSARRVATRLRQQAAGLRDSWRSRTVPGRVPREP